MDDAALKGKRPSTAGVPTLIIRPTEGWAWLNLRELWQYHDLFYFLAWRDIKVRYKQTAIGVAWAILQPLSMMVIFSLFFGLVIKIPSDGKPYPIFYFTALLPWTCFANGMNQASNSLVNSANLISKIYFPRLIIPLSAVLTGVIDFALAFIVLVGMMVYYGVHPTWNALWLPAFLLLALVTALGVGLWLSALNVEYRDVRYMVPLLSQLWLFASPVMYSSSLFHGKWRLLLELNPMTGVIDGFRWALLGTESAPGTMFGISVAAALTLLLTSALYFRRMERSFADVV
jgi:lipopolysaccharide transport system permease protein